MNIIVTVECSWCRSQRRSGETAVAIFAQWPTPGMMDDFLSRQMRYHHSDHPGGISVRFCAEGKPEPRPIDDDEDAQSREALRPTETLETVGMGSGWRRKLV